MKKYFFIIVIFSLGFAASVHAAVVADVSGYHSSDYGSGSQTLTVSLTVPSTSNRFLVCFVSRGGTAAPWTSATFNGVNMTDLANATDSGSVFWGHIFTLVNPAVGTHNANFVVTAGGATNSMAGACTSYSGVDPTNSVLDSFYKTEDYVHASSTLTTVNGGYVSDNLVASGAQGSAVSPQTEIANDSTLTFFDLGASIMAATSTQTRIGWTNGSTRNIYGSVSLCPAGSSCAGPTPPTPLGITPIFPVDVETNLTTNELLRVDGATLGDPYEATVKIQFVDNVQTCDTLLFGLFRFNCRNAFSNIGTDIAYATASSTFFGFDIPHIPLRVALPPGTTSTIGLMTWNLFDLSTGVQAQATSSFTFVIAPVGQATSSLTTVLLTTITATSTSFATSSVLVSNPTRVGIATSTCAAPNNVLDVGGGIGYAYCVVVNDISDRISATTNGAVNIAVDGLKNVFPFSVPIQVYQLAMNTASSTLASSTDAMISLTMPASLPFPTSTRTIVMVSSSTTFGDAGLTSQWFRLQDLLLTGTLLVIIFIQVRHH